MSNSLQGVSLYLIGMMGAGKTTIGKLVAQQLGYQFFDTDTTIEQVAGSSIGQLFAQGEAGFRDLESRVLAELCAYKRLTIATGGGIVLRRENWGYLRHGIVVWLDVPLEQLYQRLQGDTVRPLLQQGDLLMRLSTLLEQRRSLYEQADVRVKYQPQETVEQTTARVLQEVQAVLKPRCDQPLE